MMDATMILIFIGNIIHCDKLFSIEGFEKGFIIVSGSKIVGIGKLENLKSQLSILHISKYKTIKLEDSQILIPGLIDTHIHAPQYPNVGIGYDLPLLEWLEKYTYKLESKYNDLDFSKRVYDAVVKKTLSYGTTTASYFGSLFSNSTLILVDSVIHHGQRALVGKINMIRNAPTNYVETFEDSIESTENFIKAVHNKKSDLVKPTITPRFAISVDMDLMEKLGELAKKYDCHVQTHISENFEEISIVNNLFGMEYAHVYDKANLLTNKTVLAHGVHLKDEEMKLLAKRQTSISHCPASNTRLQSGLCDVKRLIDNNINVGLGTDAAGGHSPSVIDAMRAALDTSIHIAYDRSDYTPLNTFDAFCLATLGGAKALALDDKIGNFEIGKDFDALIVDMNVNKSSADLLEEYHALELLQKFVYLGDDRNILKVYVAGNQVK